MFRQLGRIFSDGGADLIGKIVGIYGVLAVANVAAWAWAFLAFRDYPVLLGTAFLAYGFGLRHAVDADHIAAIDNVTRKLMQEGKRPVAAGVYFSRGPLTGGPLAPAFIALAPRALQNPRSAVRAGRGGFGAPRPALLPFRVRHRDHL